jgi:two-component system LytT family response regulator
MSTLSAILVDDEASSLRSLRYEIEKYCPDVEILDAIQDPVKAVQVIEEHGPDVVFLDIEMPKMNGFDLLQSFSSVDFDVIFVTAYDEFAVRAFEFNAVDYLLKPVLKTKLIQSVKKVSEKQKHQFAQSDLQALMQNIQRGVPEPSLASIAIPTTEGFELILISEIVYLQAESNYTWLFLESKEKHLISRTMKEVSQMINNPQFFRAHKSYLVNLAHVRRYVRGRGGYLVLKDSTQIPVARSQRSVLMETLNL